VNPPTPGALATRGPGAALVTVIAVANGVIVANLYYLQPVLHQVRGDFHLSESGASILITLAQLGYAAGLVLVAPLGDLVERRRLAVTVYALAGLVLGAVAVTRSYALFVPLIFVVGLVSVGAQILVPFAADLAEPSQRGRVIARVMSGLLIGVLLSRTVSGLIAQAAGWRAVFVVACGALLVTAAVLAWVLPSEPARDSVPYWRLIRGSFALLAEHAELRRRALYGSLVFAAMSIVWTELAFHLSGAPFHYSKAVIGLFGLFGVAGVVAANFAGHFADRRREHAATVGAAGTLTVSFLVLMAGDSLFALGAGLILMDAGMQAVQITNQSIIYRLVPDARGRVTSAYMFCAFVGASFGSAAGGLLYQHAGWAGDCWLGLGLSVALLAPALVELRRAR
jgi:predicted MFS family arabinose efflux permease